MASNSNPVEGTTAARLAEIRERERAASEGPWQHEHGADRAKYNYRIYDRQNRGVCKPTSGSYPHDEANSEFIKHARQDIPYLLDLVQQQDAALEALIAKWELREQVLKDRHRPQAGRVEQCIRELRQALLAVPEDRSVTREAATNEEILRARDRSDVGGRQDLREVPDTKGSER